MIACIVLAVPSFLGPRFWWLNAVETIPMLENLVPLNASLIDVVLALMGVLLLITHFPVCLYRVYAACRKNGTSFLGALLQLSPFLCITCASLVWMSSPFSGIVQNHVVAFSITIGIVFGELATRIILAHLLKKEFPFFSTLMVPLVVGAVLSNTPVFLDMYFVSSDK